MQIQLLTVFASTRKPLWIRTYSLGRQFISKLAGDDFFLPSHMLRALEKMSAMARKKNSIVECTILQIDLENTRLQEGNKQTKKKNSSSNWFGREQSAGYGSKISHLKHCSVAVILSLELTSFTGKESEKIHLIIHQKSTEPWIS